MRKQIPLLALTILAVTAVGCANKGQIPKNDSVTDINVAPVPPREPELAYTAAPVPQQPAYYDASVTQTPGAGVASGGNYTVKKGDTLFGIAKTAYGNGNQWQRIASANPGLSPGTLKAGQTITLP
jgi:nucleoid-associated protein YgaU